MALIPCSVCGRQLSQLATACPGCGHPLSATLATQIATQTEGSGGTPTWLSVVGIILGCLAALLFIGYLMGSSPEAKEQAGDRAAIEMCESQIRRQPYGSGEAIIVRGACDILKKQFEHKYGLSP